MRSRILPAVALAFLQIMPAPAALALHQRAQPLQLGTITSGQASSDVPAVFTFQAETAGMLTVVVRGKGDVDLTLAVTDALGQPLPDGRADNDLGGDTGAEQLVATLRRPGEYRVQVDTWSGSGLFDIAAGWISFPAVAAPPDPDGLPSSAAPLVPGSPIDDAIDSDAGDLWDWFKITVESDSVITVVTSAPAGDLALEVFNEGDFGEAVNRSDQDIQGVAGNESLTVQATAGETYYFRVSPVFEGQGRIAYQIRVGVM